MIIAAIILTSLTVFWGVSLVNVVRHKGTEVGQDVRDNPLSPAFTTALIGTLILFPEALVYSYLRFIGTNSNAVGSFYTPSDTLSLLGALVFSAGCLLHAWSVRVRGRYAVSWAMSQDHRIITDPPYNMVRHPSYLGYMLMIIGMTVTWGNLVTIIPWVAIPGYYYVSIYEEVMLIERFGDEYREYMKRVNSFIPRI